MQGHKGNRGVGWSRILPVVLSLVAGLVTQTVSAGDAALVGAWPLAADANDTLGSHNGIVKGGTRFSIDDKAAVFDGVSSYINLGDVPLRASFSISLWLRPDWPDDSGIMRILGRFKLQDNKILAVFADKQARIWTYISQDGAVDNKNAIVKATAEPAIPESDRWYFVGVRWDSTKFAEGMTFLIDGVPVSSVVASEAQITGLSTQRLDLTLAAFDVQTVTDTDGTSREVVNNAFRGMMSGLSIWDGVLSDDAVASQFAAGRLGKVPDATAPPPANSDATKGAATQQPPPPAIKDLADNAQALDNERDYNTVFTSKQSLLTALNNATLADSDIADTIRLVKFLAEDLYSEQRVDLAKRLRGRWLADKVAMGKRSEAELLGLFEAIWIVSQEQGREALAAWFADPALWNAVSGKGLAFAAMLAGKPWSSIEMPGSVLDVSGLPAIEARLLAQESNLDREALANAALTFGYAGDLQRSLRWGLKTYSAVFGDTQGRANLTLTDLKFVADVVGQEWLHEMQSEYPEFIEVLLRLAGAGTLPSDKATLDSLARLCSGPNARQSLAAEVKAHPDAARLPLARIMTSAIRRGQDLDAWCGEMDRRISSSTGDEQAFWTIARGDAEVIRIYPVVPGRRLPGIRKAEALLASDNMRLAWARELADYYSGRDLPDKAAGELAAKSDLLAGEKSAEAVSLIHSLDLAKTDLARKQARFQRLIRHERLKRQQDYLERMKDQAAKRGDAARVVALDAQLVSVREEVSR